MLLHLSGDTAIKSSGHISLCPFACHSCYMYFIVVEPLHNSKVAEFVITDVDEKLFVIIHHLS